MNKIAKLKRAVNNRRASSDKYFAPMENLAWDFYAQEYDMKVDACCRSDFLHSFLLAVVQQTAYQYSEEEYWYNKIAFALGDPGFTVDLFDEVMETMLPAMPGRRQVDGLFKAVRKHR